MSGPLDLIFGDDWGTAAVVPPVDPASGGHGPFGRRYFGRRHFGPRYFPPAVVVVVPPAAGTFLEALRTRLVDAPTLSDLTGVYLTTSPAGAAFPYLVASVVDEFAEVNSSESYYESVQMQFDLLALDADECLALGRAARELLLPRAANPSLAFGDGYELARWATRARGPYAEGAGMPEGETVWRYRWEMTHMIGRD